MQSRFEGRVLSWSLHPVLASQVVHCYVTDITDRLNLEAQFRQSQKMESVGQLAAGVAHDFNNMLTVIQGHSGMLLARPTLPPELRDSVQAVYFAAERAASLTRQLLMFSRKGVLQPQPLDLREVIGNMSKMLKRLLGETIVLQFNPPLELPFVQGDTGMIEQVIMNLAINARDAMPTGGNLTISVEPAEIETSYVQGRPEARPGNYVRLSVVDSGQGMDTATMSRIFEPFFTTKDVGKGTGLGLATVYGIIKQHQGWIDVASQPGHGASFSVFLPASDEVAKGIKPLEAPAAYVSGGAETILLVEDEESVLAMGKMILEDCGYRVLEALSGVKALDVFQQHETKIDLLLTDMIMPQGLSGIELAQKLIATKPQLKVIFTSGYNVSDMDADFIHAGGGTFVQKPYTRSTLAKAVRESLDRDAPQAEQPAQ